MHRLRSPDFFEKEAMRRDFTGMLHAALEEIELELREFYLAVIRPDTSAYQLHFDMSKGERHGFRSTRSCQAHGRSEGGAQPVKQFPSKSERMH